MNDKKPLLIVTGPTATGKNRFAVKLGIHLQQKNIKSGIVNCDSLCFYRELNIGTAKPTIEERQGLPHALIDNASIEKPINAARFRSEALEVINSLHQKNAVPILVGGSSFYIRALIKGMYQSSSTPKEVKLRVQEIYQSKGATALRSYLQKYDPASLATIHSNDLYRTMRAVEFHMHQGKAWSLEKEKFDRLNPYDFSRPHNENWQVHTFYLDIPKNKHLQIIQKRTEKMIKDGIIDEVKALLKQGFSGQEKPLLSIGHKETQEYLKGKISNTEDLKERINISTRQLAKAQRTFLNKIHPKIKFNPLNEGKRHH